MSNILLMVLTNKIRVVINGSLGHSRGLTPLVDTGKRSMKGRVEMAHVHQVIRHVDGDAVGYGHRVPLDQLQSYDDAKHGVFKPFDDK